MHPDVGSGTRNLLFGTCSGSFCEHNSDQKQENTQQQLDVQSWVTSPACTLYLYRYEYDEYFNTVSLSTSSY
jgi:hypothetical protein